MFLRRYAPALLIAVALLLAIAFAPSRPGGGGGGSIAATAYPPFDPSGSGGYSAPTYGASGSAGGGAATVAGGARGGAGVSTPGPLATSVARGSGGASTVDPAGQSVSGQSSPGAAIPVTGAGGAATAGAPVTTPTGGPRPTAGAGGGVASSGGAAPTARSSPGATSGTKTGGKSGSTGGAKAGGPATGTGTAPTGTGAGTGPAPGDTSHCAGNKQFGGFISAPPCQPTFSGDNGGATSSGVTASTVEIVYYREADSAVVKAIEQDYGIYSDPANQAAMAAAIQTFANSRYELYGRKVHIDFVPSPGGCSTSPPDDTCERSDADAIVAQFHPFAVFFEDSTNTPGFFDELSKAGVVNFGGWHLADSFSTDRRPFHYDFYTGGDVQAQEAGDWYCKRLANQNAKFAGDATLQASKRKAAILVQDIDLNVTPAQHLAQLIDQCDSNGAQVFTYSPDTGTSQEQAVTLVSKMKAAGITSVIYFCDPIAPQFFTDSETSQSYDPENIIAGSGLLDYDILGQTYDQARWKHAFGLSDSGDAENISKTEAQAVFTAGGGSGALYTSGNLPWNYLSQILAGIQQAGPTLNPGTFEHGMLTLPATGGDRFDPTIAYGAGDYTGVSDYREVYWDPGVVSPDNGKAGAYVSLNNGARYVPGKEPSGPPAFPAGV